MTCAARLAVRPVRLPASAALRALVLSALPSTYDELRARAVAADRRWHAGHVARMMVRLQDEGRVRWWVDRGIVRIEATGRVTPRRQRPLVILRERLAAWSAS